MHHRLRNLLLTSTVILVVLFSALVLLARIYEPEVKQALVSAINERLDAPVEVREMELTLIARFPMAGLRLHDVLAMERRTDGLEADTLLHASDLFLEMSLWNLVRGRHVIERIHGRSVDLRPGLDRNGTGNYLILKPDSVPNTSGTIALERVSFDGLKLRFRDDRSGLEVKGHSSSMRLAGRFSEALNEIDLEGDLTLEHWQQGRTLVLDQRKADLRLSMTFGGDDSAFRIPKGEVMIAHMPLEITLELTGPGEHMDLRANGLGIPLEQAIALLPSDLRAPLKDHAVRGTADVALRYSGSLEGPGPSLALGVKLTKAQVTERRSGTRFDDISGELGLDLTPEGTPSRIVAKGFTARSGKGRIAGNWESTGISNAPVKAELHVDLGLAELLRFMKVDTLEQVSGRIKANATMEGRLRSMADLKVADLKALRFEGGATLRGASMKLKGVRHRVEDIDADLVLEANDARIDGLNVTVQGNTVNMRGTLRDLMPYLLFDDQQLTIDAEATSAHLDLATWLRGGEDRAKGKGPGYELSLPATITLDLRTKVDELVFEEFKATGIQGTVHMKDRMLRVAPVTFNTASGAVLGSLELDARGPRGSDHRLAIDAVFQGMDIAQLFREFQDFGQDFIGHRHLSGTSQARVELRAPLSPSMSIDMDRLQCSVDIAIDDGGIKGHKPLMEVAEHLRRNKLVAPLVNTQALRDQLADVRFARLENRIEIRDGAVRIPTMEVRSNTLDIELSGTHWFDDRIDHHINFRLGDLFRVGKPQRDEFGPIVDDGTGMRLFLHMYGTASDPSFANDGAMASARRRQQFQQEKQELRSILHQDLGLFKGRGTRTTDEPVSQVSGKAPSFEVEWEGEKKAQAPGEPRAKEEQAPERPRKGLGKLLDKVAKEKEEPGRTEVFEEP